MRKRVLGGAPTNYYHVVSRVVDRRYIFGSREKRHFRHLMRRLLTFSGLRCVTFCLMDNHFHLLLEVPDEEGEVFSKSATEADILERVEALYSPAEAAAIRGEAEELRCADPTSNEGTETLAVAERRDAGAQYLKGFLRRMYSLSVFMKELKGAFTQWFNQQNSRQGTLWEARYRSVLCEGAGETLLTVAAYIDLNPVRAGIVADPGDFPWSGYGEAKTGRSDAHGGLTRALSMAFSVSRRWEEVYPRYRDMLEARGSVHQRAAMLRVRVRSFTEGFAIGARSFLEDVFQTNRDQFGRLRRDCARKIGGSQWGNLFAARDVHT